MMLKRIMVLGVLFLLMCSCALAEGKIVEVSTVAELQESLESAADGTTIRLTKDLTITERLGTYDQIAE